MTEAVELDTANRSEMRAELAAMHAAQGDGAPVWRERHRFNANLMFGFDARGGVLLRLRTGDARKAEIIEIAPDEARELGNMLFAAADAMEPREATI